MCVCVPVFVCVGVYLWVICECGCLWVPCVCKHYVCVCVLCVCVCFTPDIFNLFSLSIFILFFSN